MKISLLVQKHTFDLLFDLLFHVLFDLLFDLLLDLFFDLLLSHSDAGTLPSANFQDKSEVDTERVKCTVMLCYGYLTLYAPSNVISSRVEANILNNINPHFANVKVRVGP